MTRGRIAATAVVVLAVSGCAAFGADEADTGSDDTTEPATVAVARGDLTETTTASGRLGYGEARDLVTLGSGIVTGLPEPGKVVEEGRPLYRVDTEPVLRLNGKVPAWRALGPGVDEGVDVRQLERALERLGHTDDLGMEIDGVWTWVTTIAVERWQEDLGLDETGELPLGSVVFTPGDVRVVDTLVEAGSQAQPGTAVLQVSDTRRDVTFSLEPTQKHLAPEGGKVDLTFPDGTTAVGTITEVETVPPSEGVEESLAVTVAVPERREIATQLDGSSVQVDCTYTLVEDVLTVPVTALVALAGGGYGVEKVAEDGTTSFVAITPGSFADTTVEIVDGELAPGDRVVVAS